MLTPHVYRVAGVGQRLRRILKGVQGIMRVAPSSYVDQSGQPLDPHIQEVLRTLLPRLRRDFPAFQDDTVVTGVLEDAGRKIAAAERRLGRLEELHGYAWVTIRSVAVSRLRLGAFTQATLELAEDTSILATTPAVRGTPEAIEREILLREVLAVLAPHERRLVLWKTAGFSSQEIGAKLSISTTAVDMQYSRLRTRIREGLNAEAASTGSDPKRLIPGRNTK